MENIRIVYETFYANKAKRVIFTEIKKLADIVGVTFGPGGQVVIINDEKNNPHLTKDGVTIAEFYQPTEEKFSKIIDIFKSIAIKTNKEVGDGTTTSVLLAFGLLKQIASKTFNFSRSHYNDILIKIEQSEKDILSALEKETIKITDKDDIRKVIDMSTNGDKELTPIIFEAINVVGPDGSITVEESHTKDTYIDLIEGFQYKSPILSKHFITDKALMSSIAKDARVFIYKDKADVFENMVPILTYCVEKNYPLIFIAEDFSPEMEEILLMNMHKNLNVIPIQAIGYGEFKQDLLDDLALYLGGIAITDTERRIIFDNPTDELNIETALGHVDKVISDLDNTAFFKQKDEQVIKDRIDFIKVKMEKEHDASARVRLQERISLLSNSLATIKVGGLSEFEVKEKIDRIDDALKAAKAALQEGIVCGGGVTLYNINKHVNNNIYIKNALLYPIKKLYSNKGLNYKKFIRMKQKHNKEAVFDLRDDGMVFKENAVDAGVIIPAKVL